LPNIHVEVFCHFGFGERANEVISVTGETLLANPALGEFAFGFKA
jgi:hypothetical protein